MTLETLRYAAARLRGIARPPVTVTDPPPGIRVERDVEVAVRDGTVLRVNVFRPETADPVPVIMCAHPYGKDRLPRRGRLGWTYDMQYRVLRQPQPVSFSALTSWEAPDPGWWVPRGYAVVNCDLRGCGSSDGTGRLLSKQEGEDYADLVEWAGTREWSTGRVGLLGVSYLAISQWRCAAERPPHLAAICPWEGFTDAYLDLMYPGGVREEGFVRMWARGVGRQRVEPDFLREPPEHPLCDEFWREMVPELERIEVPMLVCASFSDHNLHSGGSFRAFERAGSERKWLYTHRGGKWATFYSAAAKAAQKRFLDRFLKGEDNGMDRIPPVRVEVREERDRIHRVCEEEAWPPPGTEWLEIRPAEGRTWFETDDRAGFSFAHRFARDTEVCGPMSLHLGLEVRGADDVNLFVAVDKFRHGRRVPFEGSYGFGLDHVTHGWRRASHRDPEHTVSRPLAPGEIVTPEIELLPSATLFRRGEELRLTVRGRWPWPRNPLWGQMPAAYEPSPKATCVIHHDRTRLLLPTN